MNWKKTRSNLLRKIGIKNYSYFKYESKIDEYNALPDNRSTKFSHLN
jgi:hypothetical protein